MERQMQVGERGYWFNRLSLENRPVTIKKVRKNHYEVRTDDGYPYVLPKSMVSREPVAL